MKFRTGNRASWEPQGFRVHLDTSWDGRGQHVACHIEDVADYWPGGADCLSTLVVRDGAEVLTGDDIFRLCHPGAIPQNCRYPGNGGLGYTTNPHLSKKEAEAAFCEAVGEAANR